MIRAHAGAMPEKVFDRCLFVTEENNRVHAVCAALEAGDLDLVGELMNQSHSGLNDLYEVCVEETNFLAERMRVIASGARQMGGGFGGCTINLIKKSVPEESIERVAAAYFERFGIKTPCFTGRNFRRGHYFVDFQEIFWIVVAKILSLRSHLKRGFGM
jgi:galactokinase